MGQRSIIPDITGNIPRLGIAQVSNRGLPVISAGPYSRLTASQLRTGVQTVVRTGFGNFDTAKTDQSHFGRTLNEIYTWAATGAFRILSHNEQWIQCQTLGPRILVFVRWEEYTDRDNSAVREMQG